MLAIRGLALRSSPRIPFGEEILLAGESVPITKANVAPPESHSSVVRCQFETGRTLDRRRPQREPAGPAGKGSAARNR